MDNALRFVRKVLRYALRPVRPFLDDFLSQVSGVIHIGANDGQERELYARFGLDVIWIEAIPEVFERLSSNLSGYAKQEAINATLSNSDDEIMEINVASNNAESSSLLEMKGLIIDRPDIGYLRKIPLRTITFRSLVERRGIDLAKYQALVVDVQGAEMLVLEGAQSLIRNFRYLKIEASEGEPYAGCPTPGELISYLRTLGFAVQRRVVTATNVNHERMFDIVFKRRGPADVASPRSRVI